MKTRSVLSRLRSDAPGSDLDRLAHLVVQEDLDTPLSTLIDTRFVAGLVRKGLQAWLRSDEAEAWLLDRVHELREWLADRDETLEELVPPSLHRAFLELAGRHYTPNRELTVFLLDREPVRKLLRDLFLDELVTFGRKLRAPVVENPLAKGLGGLGRFARDRAKSSGAFGALASDVVGAVSGELERQVDKRAAEFADAALSRVLQRLADLLCDPEGAGDQAALREALVEGFFELQAFEIADELKRSEPLVTSEILRRGMLAWIEGESSLDELAEIFDAILAEDAGLPLRDVLERLGLLESYVELAHEASLRRIRGLVESEVFADWLTALLEEEEGAGEVEQEAAPPKPRARRKRPAEE